MHFVVLTQCTISSTSRSELIGFLVNPLKRVSKHKKFLKNMGEDDDKYTKDGTVDYHGNPADRSKTGTWKACPFILGIYFAIHLHILLVNLVMLWIR